jgi:2-dehydropantoate 2-reductase
MGKKILIYGAGVIGSTYGGLMAKSGYTITVLARNRRLIELKKQGLLLQRINEIKSEKILVNVISNSGIEGSYDYVFVTLRNDQIKQALSELSTINSPCFVFMVNTCLGYKEWIDAIGYERVIPAYPGSGGKIENGIVYYEIVSKMAQPTTIGELSGSTTNRIKELREILVNSGFKVSFSKNMDSWQKNHIALVGPLAGAIYFDGGNNYSVARNNRAIVQMNLALKGNFTFLKKSGIGIEPSKLNIFRYAPLFMLGLVMKYLFNTKWAETVISNHALNARQEMELISNEFIELAESKGFQLVEFKKLVGDNIN